MTLEIIANAALRLMLLAALAWLAVRALRVRNAHVEALVWRSALLAGFALPALLISQMAPSFPAAIETADIVAVIPGAALGTTAGPTVDLAPFAAAIYLLVAAALLLRQFVALAVMGRIVRAARKAPYEGDVRISERVRSPATFGAIVLLPPDAQSWPAEKLDAVLAHERAHVRAGDGYWSWLAQLHAAVFWFVPSSWWIQRRLETLAETTSDDAVLIARHDPADYAALLLDFARRPNSRSVVMSVAESNVSERIERLLARTPPSAPLSRAARWTALFFTLPLVVIAASTTHAIAETQTPATPPSPSGVRLTQPADPDNYYPPVAKAQNVAGFAIVEVDVDALGQLVDARIVKVEPADPQYGFGDAALQVARNTVYSNASQQTGSLKFMVKFALDAPAAGAAPASAAATAAPAPAPVVRHVRVTRVADPANFYPKAAKSERLEGEALVEVAVDPSGGIVNVAVLEVTPADPRYGFGPAAERVARASGYANSHTEVETIKFKVKFAYRR